MASSLNLLVIEDDEIISSFLKKGFDEQAYQSEFVNNGEDAIEKILSREHQFVILDLMLPKLNGLQVLQQIRSQNIKTPILILSAKQNVDDRIKALESGADDFLMKPFVFAELNARIKSLIRRNSYSQDEIKIEKNLSSEKVLTYGDLKFDLLKQEVFVAKQKLNCTLKSFHY